MPNSPKQPPLPKPAEDAGDAAKDQKGRQYYYDDAHGYEQYDPAEDEECEVEDTIPKDIS
jgi:hypothetical protein